MPRFVVLDHDWPHPHRDLLLERDGVLKAWRLPTTFELTSPVPAEANFDHRLIYLDYEGPLSGNRGEVRRWDAGELMWEAFGEEEIRVRLDGTHLRGLFRLVKGESGWVFEKENFTAKGT